MKALVGLGNPGQEYVGTRHNLGFMVIRSLIKRHKIKNRSGKPQALVNVWSHPKHGDILLVRPRTFMNLSGKAVAWLIQAHKIPVTNIIVILDDLSLKLGCLRLRSKGSSAGHKGLQHIIDTLQTTNIPRLRLGIGPIPESQDPKQFVLNRFTENEWPTVQSMLTRACDCIEYLLQNGIEKAMNKFNGPWEEAAPTDDHLPSA